MLNQYSVRCAVSIFYSKAGEKYSCLGVDIQAARPAPFGKRFGIDKDVHHDMATSSQLLLTLFGFHEPFVECSGEIRAVGYDPEDGAVIFEAVPSHACSSDSSLTG